VVDDARPETSPLHPQFEWDDTTAAEEHRKAQARLLMRSIYAVVEDNGKNEPTVVPAFVQISQDGERRYEAFQVVVSDPELWEQVVEQARRDWRSFERKYRQYSQLASLFEAADAVWQEVA
jgi:hypothetical protein